MEKEGSVKRTVYALIPLRVDYELTEMVRELIPIWKLLSECGGKHSDLIQISEALEEKSF